MTEPIRRATPDSATVRNVPTGPARKGPTGIEPARITAGQPGTTGARPPARAARVVIDAKGVYYKTLNEQIREEIEGGATEVVLDNVIGQRYIGTGLAYPGRDGHRERGAGQRPGRLHERAHPGGERQRPGRRGQHHELRPGDHQRRRRRRARLRHARRLLCTSAATWATGWAST